jgi:hypothetical protein
MEEDSDDYGYSSGDDEMQELSEEVASGSDEDFGYDASAEIEINSKKVTDSTLESLGHAHLNEFAPTFFRLLIRC